MNFWAPLAVLFGGIAFIAELLRLVKRAENAAERAEKAANITNKEQVCVDHKRGDHMLRVAARWGSEVLNLIANGRSASEAVRLAVPRTRCLDCVLPENIVENHACSKTPAEVLDESNAQYPIESITSNPWHVTNTNQPTDTAIIYRPHVARAPRSPERRQ